MQIMTRDGHEITASQAIQRLMTPGMVVVIRDSGLFVQIITKRYGGTAVATNAMINLTVDRCERYAEILNRAADIVDAVNKEQSVKA